VVLLFRFLSLAACLTIVLSLSGQKQIDPVYSDHMYQAQQFIDLQLYAEGLNEYEKAVEFTRLEHYDSLLIASSIAMAELMRITQDFNDGLDVLAELQNTERFPLLHVRKLGRKVALIHENTYSEEFHKKDTVRYYLSMAINLAIRYKFKKEEASLKNELGYFVSRNESYFSGLPILFEAADLFISFGDTQNYVSAMTHVFDDYMELKDYKKTDSLRNYLNSIVKNTTWYLLQMDLYYLFSKDLRRRNDLVGAYYWLSKTYRVEVKYEKSISNRQMTQYRVMHDTKKYQDEARESALVSKQKELELIKEEQLSNDLSIYLSLLFLIIIAFVFLFFRERKLKAQLNFINRKLYNTNEKYLDLVIESNHRIKNNLQMVISMLRYSSKDLGPKESVAFRKISGKIRTVSALHKHLYLGVHNEKVSVRKYFEEIIDLYKEISDDSFVIKLELQEIEIESETLVYFGLIFNEMLTNTFEHNLSEKKYVQIIISLNDAHYLFEYTDGSPHDSNKSQGNGIELIRNLVKRVKGEDFKLDQTTGTYRFLFNI